MTDLKEFARQLPDVTSSHVDRAVALLWFYMQTQTFEERTSTEIAADLHDLGFPKPNVSRLADGLRRSKFTIRGKRKYTFQIDARKSGDLEEKFSKILKTKVTKVSNAVVPLELVAGTRQYLERLVTQINGSYDNGWYDCCAVLCRRLIESLIVESYIAHNLRTKIEMNGQFKMLDALIATIKSETAFKIARNSGKAMDLVKEIGDTAAHDRTYLTQMQDIDDLKPKIRPLLSDLLSVAKIK